MQSLCNPDSNLYYLIILADKMKTVPDILSLGINFRPIVMINTVLVMPGVSLMYNALQCNVGNVFQNDFDIKTFSCVVIMCYFLFL